MMEPVQETFNESPWPVAQHLFQIDGQNVLSVGGRELNCRNLTTGGHSKLMLDKFGGKKTTLFKASSHPV
ncbi:hypothetical protein BJ741DRAFT_634083 [Chytriomyces cf. hyalinus JEL632]|nr:hypothetical protein BJ741DRAFT_634083 [Chytriomyces cf. hyalinus JEL632]